MLAKHSRQWPIIEGLNLGLRVVYKIHRLIECYTPYGPRNLQQGDSSTLFPPTEYYMCCIPGLSKKASASISTAAGDRPGGKVSRRLRVP